MSAATPLPASGVTTADKRYEPSMEEILASIRRIIADDQTLPGKTLEPAPPTSLHQPVRSAEVAPFPTPTAACIEPAAPQSEPVACPPEQVVPAIEPAAPASELRAHGIVATPQFVAPEGPSAEPAPPIAPPELRQEPAAAPHVPEPVVSAPQVYDDIEDDGDLYETAIEPAPAVDTNAEDEDEDEAFQAHGLNQEPAHEEPPAALFSAATDTSLTSAFNMLAASRLADNSDELMNLAREMIRPLLRSWIDDNLPSMVERMVRAEIERVARGGR